MKKLLAITLTLVMLIGALSTVTMSVNATDATVTSTDDGWDGTTATQPAGYGTEEEPYLISSAANLKWMSNQAGASQAGGTQIILQGYFEQTCDIDLNGKTLSSIGCYLNDNFINKATESATINAFGGVYNGNGYSIKNGNIVNKNTTHDPNGNWSTGLFGVIWGATIENIVLDNIQVTDTNMVAALVGEAQSYADAEIGYNTIRNCVVKSNCTVTGTDASDLGAAWNAQANLLRIGGIVALGANVVIENCINGATLIAPSTKNPPLMGGIAAQIGRGATITNCVNTGVMSVDYSENAAKNLNNKMMIQGGGIVGLMTFTASRATTSVTSTVTIENCYNTGKMSFIVPAANNKDNPLGVTNNDLNWGGIAGTIGADGGSGTVNIKTCYNLANECATAIAWRGADANVAGIVGQVRRGKTTMDNCYSVAVDGNYTYGTAGSGWFGTALYCGNGAVYADNGCAIKTADEVKVYTDAIDKTVACNLVYGRDSVNYIGVQKALAEGDNRVRVVAGVNTTDVKAVGFEATLESGKKAEMLGYTVYESITANGEPIVAGTGDYEDITYFVTMVFNPVQTVEGVATPVSGTVTGRFFVINNYGVKVYGSEAFTLVFENGVLTAPAADVE